MFVVVWIRDIVPVPCHQLEGVRHVVEFFENVNFEMIAPPEVVELNDKFLVVIAPFPVWITTLFKLVDGLVNYCPIAHQIKFVVVYAATPVSKTDVHLRHGGRKAWEVLLR